MKKSGKANGRPERKSGAGVFDEATCTICGPGNWRRVSICGELVIMGNGMTEEE